MCNTLYRYVETLTDRSTNTVESWRDIVNWLEAAGYKTSEQQETVDWGEAPDISLSQLAEDISLRILKSEIIQAMDSLQRRSLIEKSKVASEVLFTLQPVVMKYVKRTYPEGL